jgi:tetratricopeptide (TPR) repeat protein
MLSRAGVAAAVLAVAILVWLGIRNAMPSLPSSPSPSDRVVVLPFDNRTGDPSLDALGTVAADRIATALQVAGHTVVPTVDAVRAALRFGGDEAAVSNVAFASDVAAETGARIIVTGEMVFISDSLRFRSRLIDARGALDLNAPNEVSAPTNAPLHGIEALRETVLSAISAQDAEEDDSRERVSDDFGDVRHDMAVSGAPALAAYIAFAEGLVHEAQGDWRGATERFGASHALDATATASLVHAALCHLRLDDFSAADSIARIAEPDSLRLTDRDRAWLRYVASYARGDMDEALRATGRLWEFAPGSIASWDLARTALRTNRARIAWSTLLSVDPAVGALRGWYPYWTVMVESLHRMGEHERELVAARRAGELHPAERGTAGLEAVALAALGRREDLERVIDEAVRAGGHEVATGALLRTTAMELRAHGDATAADSMLLRALAWTDSVPDTLRTSAAHRQLRALVLEDLGRIEEAERIVADPATGGTTVRRTGWLGRLAAQRGDTATAIAAERTLADFDAPYSFGRPFVGRAGILARLGDADGALALLHEARTRGWVLPRHPEFVFPALAAEPAFARLVRPPD